MDVCVAAEALRWAFALEGVSLVIYSIKKGRECGKPSLGRV